MSWNIRSNGYCDTALGYVSYVVARPAGVSSISLLLTDMQTHQYRTFDR